MRWGQTACVSILTVALMACGQAGIGVSGPTSDELVQALNGANVRPVLDYSLGSCQPGTIGEASVQVCGFCAVTVGIGRGENNWEEGAYVQAVRHNGTVAFRRAFSAEQPDVEPGPGQRGVWLAVQSTFELGDDSPTIALSNAQMRRIGYTRRTHLSSFIDSANTRVSDEISERIISDQAMKDEILALVGDCSGRIPQTAQPQSNASEPETISEAFNQLADAVGSGSTEAPSSPPTAAELAAARQRGEAAAQRIAYRVVSVQERPFFYVENCSSHLVEEEASVVQQAVDALPQVMARANLTIAGPLTTVYRPYRPGRSACLQVGYPYSGRAAPGNLLIGRIGRTPGGRLLRIDYAGSNAIADVYDPMNALLARARLDDPTTANDDWVTFEVYHDDPTQTGGSRNREIYYVTEGDISPLTRLVAPQQ